MGTGPSKVLACAGELSGDSLLRWNTLMESTGCREVMALELARPLERQENILVLA